MTFANGEEILIDHEGRTVEGFVMMASPNGQSLMIGFEALLGGHIGMMPVTMTSETEGFSIIDGTEVTIRKKVLQ